MNKQKKIIPLSVPNINLDCMDNLKECIETGWVSTGGRFIGELEEKLAAYTGSNGGVSVQSGTAGLHLALQALGLNEGEEVIVPALTFIASVNPVKYLGAEPVFIDCGENLCIDPEEIEAFCREQCEQTPSGLINKNTKRKIVGIIPVHVFGNLCDMVKINQIADEFRLFILEDAAEALGSYFTEGPYAGCHAGTMGDAGVFSFNANKIITTGGGGFVVSKDKNVLDKIRYLSMQAKNDSLYFVHDEVGYNYRMPNIQAAIGVSQLDQLESFIEKKINNYEAYKARVNQTKGIKLLPFTKGQRSNHWFYSLVIDKSLCGKSRDQLLTHLIDHNIQCRPLWRLIHRQKPYENNQAYHISKASYFEENLLNIPCSTNLTTDDIQAVCSNINEFTGRTFLGSY